jgi:hypothetical protein
MKFRTRLSLLSLETRENPSLAIAPPVTNGVTAGPVGSAASGAATSTATTTPGSGQITSTGNVNVTTTTNPTATTTVTVTAPTTGILATGNNLSGQPLLESSLVGN